MRGGGKRLRRLTRRCKRQQRCEHVIHVLEHISIQNTKNTVAQPTQLIQSHRVPCQFRIRRMRPAIDLHNNLSFPAKEIHVVVTDRRLPHKLQIAQPPAAQLRPELHLS